MSHLHDADPTAEDRDKDLNRQKANCPTLVRINRPSHHAVARLEAEDDNNAQGDDNWSPKETPNVIEYGRLETILSHEHSPSTVFTPRLKYT